MYGDRVYVTHYRGYGIEDGKGTAERLERYVVCLDVNSGRVRWKNKAPTDTPVQQWSGFITRHGYASPSVAVDNGTIYAFFDTAGAVAIDEDGRWKWKQAETGQKTHSWGSGSSPVVYQDMVLITAGVESGAIGALATSDGSIVWHNDSVEECWGTPVVVRTPAGRDQIVLSMKGRIVGLNPFSGAEEWTCQGIDDYVCPSVVAGDGVVYAIGGRSGKAIAVKTGGQGDVTNSHVLWTADYGSNVPTPVLYGDRLMWVSDTGIAYCLDAATGERLGRRRLDAGTVYASTVAAGGRLYVVSRDRGTYVLTADKDMRQVAHNVIRSDESVFNATPAIIPGRLVLRSNEFVYCIGRQPSVDSNDSSVSSR